MKKLISLLLLLMFLISMVSCGTNNKNDVEYKVKTHEVLTPYFNAPSVISCYGDTSNEEFEKYVEITEQTFKFYHELFDIYHEYSGVNNIRTINKNAGVAPVKVSDDLIEFLLYCKELFTITQGKTNIMLGSVLSIWHNCSVIANDNNGILPTGMLPSSQDLEEAAKHTSINSLIINEDEGTVYISDPKASIDVGAIGKGYAVEKLYQRLVSEGADSMAINAGGNIKTIGIKPNGDKWEIGITNPDLQSNERFACRIRIAENALVTSGDYERNFVCDGKIYHHVIDPSTLLPAEYFSSVSVLTDNSAIADALSTALFCMSYEQGANLVSSLNGVEVIWITKSGELKHTDGIEFISTK